MTTPMIFAGAMGISGGVDIGDNIANSLMLDSSLSQYLSRTPSVAGSRSTWTFSAWMKRGKIGAQTAFYGTNYVTGGSTNGTEFRFDSTDSLTIVIANVPGSFGTCVLQTTALYRDPTAWLHLMVVLDTTEAVSTDRIKVYVNGVRITSFVSPTYPPLNNATATVNNTQAHYIGAGSIDSVVGRYLDGYDSATYFIDGQALTPASFGRVSADTGQWVPKNYTGTYGTNGFRLDFTNGAALGTDSSGNGNNWTLNGGITSANQYTDTPTNNYAVWNSLNSDASAVLSIGNTKATTPSTNARGVTSSLAIPRTGKWAMKVTPASHINNWIGVTNIQKAATDINTAGANAALYYANGKKWVNGTNTAYGAAWTTEQIEVVVDSDANTVTFYKAGVSQGAITLPSSSIDYCFVVANAAGASLAMQGDFGAKGFSSSATGAKALCTANLPEGTATAPATFTGNASTDGAYVPMNGTPETATINGNAVTWGTHADRTAGGMKLRTSSASYNASGSNTLAATFLTPNRKSVQKYQTAKGNP